MTKLNELSKRSVRYWCFRYQNEAQGGAKATGSPRGLKKYFEALDLFEALGGWSMFADKWDVNEQSPLEIVVRKKSITQQWREDLIDGAMPLPGAAPDYHFQRWLCAESDDPDQRCSTNRPHGGDCGYYPKVSFVVPNVKDSDPYDPDQASFYATAEDAAIASTSKAGIYFEHHLFLGGEVKIPDYDESFNNKTYILEPVNKDD